MSSEPLVDWSQNPEAAERQMMTLLENFDDMVTGLEEVNTWQNEHTEREERDYEQLIVEESMKGYDALRSAVSKLVLLDDGDKISRNQGSHQDVMEALRGAVIAFEIVAGLSGDYIENLGKTASDHMSMGDLADQLEKELKAHVESLNKQAKEVFDVCDSYWRNMKDSESEARSLSDAASRANDEANNAFWGYSDSDREKVRSWRERAEQKRANAGAYNEKYRTLYKFYIRIRNTSAATMDLVEQVQEVSKEFDNDFARVTDEQTKEGRIWQGLLKLRNHIQNPDLTYNRDKALRVILQLLQQDDDVFDRKDYYEQTETDIKATIQQHLGSNALESIMNVQIEGNFLDEL